MFSIFFRLAAATSGRNADLRQFRDGNFVASRRLVDLRRPQVGKMRKKLKKFPMLGCDHVARGSLANAPSPPRARGGALFTGRYVPWWLGRFLRWDLLSRGCMPAHANIVNCFYPPGVIIGRQRSGTVSCVLRN